jgi:hypothetical protein
MGLFLEEAFNFHGCADAPAQTRTARQEPCKSSLLLTPSHRPPRLTRQLTLAPVMVQLTMLVRNLPERSDSKGLFRSLFLGTSPVHHVAKRAGSLPRSGRRPTLKLLEATARSFRCTMAEE